MTKYVYDFSEGNRDMKDLLGGKGANLAEMTNMGLPVPHGFTVTTEACLAYLARGGSPDGLTDEVERHLQFLFKAGPELIQFPARDTIAGQIQVACLVWVTQRTAKEDQPCGTIRFGEGNRPVKVFLLDRHMSPEARSTPRRGIATSLISLIKWS